MKKIIFYSMLFASVSLAGCDKDDDPIFEDADQRLSKTLFDYQSALVAAPNGWKATLYPKGGKGFTYYFKFEADGTVTMVSDFNASTAGVAKKSTFRMKALQRPTLIFDTYSYIHLPADPTASISTGATGTGLSSDFQFAVISVSDSEIKLEGTVNENELVLVKVSADEAAAFQEGRLKSIMTETAAYLGQNPYVYLDFADGNKVQTSLNASTKSFSLTYVESNVVQASSAIYSYTTGGIVLQKPLNYKGKEIRELYWDADKGLFYITLDGKRSDILVSATPIVPLNLLLGVDFNVITVAEGSGLPGWSPEFTARRAAAAAATLAGRYGLRLGNMAFTFNTQTKTMNIVANVYQGANGFIATFPYTYTKAADGTFDFTAQAPIGNAALIIEEMKPITDPIKDQVFKLDYFSDPTKGTVGQFQSITEPNLYFAGALSK